MTKDSAEMALLDAAQAPGSCELAPMAGAAASQEPGALAPTPIVRVGYELGLGRGIEYPVHSANYPAIEANKSVKEVVHDTIRPAAEEQLKTKASWLVRLCRAWFRKPCIREATVNTNLDVEGQRATYVVPESTSERKELTKVYKGNKDILGASVNFDTGYKQFLVGDPANKLIVVSSKLDRRAVLLSFGVVAALSLASGVAVAVLVSGPGSVPGGVALAAGPPALVGAFITVVNCLWKH
ncbi:hypothetical protein QBC47DRAFT_395669 [Echria macrotheca]|uniref:Uncharacterized protein n=1 Tax=Echria macrotheca TaxID=438768 RepID=A0AAJ0B1I0_9PEZI|nr:hypothetical protein QBC47DRAFT_395669 [Echria macrotheca]